MKVCKDTQPLQADWVDIGDGFERKEFLSRREFAHRSTDDGAKWHCGVAMKKIVVALRKVDSEDIMLQKPDTFFCTTCCRRIAVESKKHRKKNAFTSYVVLFFSREIWLGR